ncbi:MAG: hypothetical protein GQ569_05060 [Methylococcaceae bacterium]|nr:hypothetical protein [Methylococcaceae bacterium]
MSPFYLEFLIDFGFAMSFSEYNSLPAVLKEFSLHYQEKALEDYLAIQAPINLKEEIAFNLTELAYDGSEAIVCETLIFPVLKAAWKPFTKELMLWSHQAIELNSKLSGIPDYLFSKQSELGKIVMDKPFVAVVEAKKDDFSGGWGQCAAEMYAASQINDNLEIPIFGIVTNGRFWEFSCLHQAVFYKYQQSGNINNLDELFSVLTHILTICKSQF